MDPAGLRPLGVGEILDVAIKIYRSRFKVLLAASAVVLAPVFVLAATAAGCARCQACSAMSTVERAVTLSATRK